MFFYASCLLTAKEVAVSGAYGEGVGDLQWRALLLIYGEGHKVVPGSQINCMPVTVVQAVA